MAATAETYNCCRIVKPGVRLGAIGNTIQKFVEAHNMTVVREYGGHGIGNQFHEPPWLPHYSDSEHTGQTLEEGMILTIEPMVNLGLHQIKALSDGWTVVTSDGSLSAQWEHTVLVTKDGAEVLTECNSVQLQRFFMPPSVVLNKACVNHTRHE